MGEPFRGAGDGLVTWFQQADLNHDGSLTLDEVRKDAERFYATLDTNHDGEIDPDDVTSWNDLYDDAYAGDVALEATPLTAIGEAALAMGMDDPMNLSDEQVEEVGVASGSDHQSSSVSVSAPSGMSSQDGRLRASYMTSYTALSCS